jgi:C4-dicarboxylate-specific signal transduction histidine kinase
MTLRAIIADFLGGERYSLGFYASRGFTLFTSMLVLGLLLWETTSLYARLARSNAMLQRERDNKLMNLQAAVASISHEIKQPLAAIAMNGAAAQRFLELSPPILGEARSALNDLVRDSHRMGEILDNIHHLFGKGEREKEPIDMNEVVLAALRLLRGELTDHCVEAVVELASEPPHVKGHRVQLQESS